MKQQDIGLNLSTLRTRKAEFLDEMELVVPWRELVSLVSAAAPAKQTGRPPFSLEAMPRLLFMQQWFGLIDLAMEQALFDIPLYRDFAGLTHHERLPARVTILRFRQLLEAHQLAEQILSKSPEQLGPGQHGIMIKPAVGDAVACIAIFPATADTLKQINVHGFLLRRHAARRCRIRSRRASMQSVTRLIASPTGSKFSVVLMPWYKRAHLMPMASSTLVNSVCTSVLRWKLLNG